MRVVVATVALLLCSSQIAIAQLQRIRAELPAGDRAVCIATGGMASVLAHETAVIQRVEPDLTLQGLRLIWSAWRQGLRAAK